jgi:predicted TIM-barrel fold metal-dependent hydrolase
MTTWLNHRDCSTTTSPPRYAELAPKFITNDNGTNAWIYEGQVLNNVAPNAVSGRPPEEYGIEPTSFDELRPGCYDIHERVKDMDANGVLGSLCFPSFPQFCGQQFARTEDKDVALAMVRAYNDWHIDEWCGTYPGRFIPCSLPAIWDPEILAAEVRRNAAKGAHAVTFSENPSKLGWPSIHTDYWDPFWKACSDEEVVVCMHIGSSSELVITSPDAPMDCLITLTPMNIVQAATDLVWSPVLRRFPNLKVALSEGGIGWIPYFLERIDHNYGKHHLWTGQDFGDRKPSEEFNDHVLTCFIDDHFGIANKDFLNLDHVMWECDYPHSDSTWPSTPEALWAQLSDLSDHDINRITHLNAMKQFHYDPIGEIGGRDRCTVGTLRASAIGHDVSIKSTRRAGTTPGAPTDEQPSAPQERESPQRVPGNVGPHPEDCVSPRYGVSLGRSDGVRRLGPQSDHRIVDPPRDRRRAHRSDAHSYRGSTRPTQSRFPGRRLVAHLPGSPAPQKMGVATGYPAIPTD